VAGVLGESKNELRELQGRISCRFTRPEPCGRALSYLKSLIGTSERKNGCRTAEAAGEATPDGVQRLLNTARWDAEEVRDDLRSYIVEHFGDTEAVLIVDETGFLKRGEKSVGVSRQYSGTAGGVENCQVGVFLCYASKKGAAFIDRALYLPREWTIDQERRSEAGIPEEVRFATKPVLARKMLERAFEEKVPAGWVTADALYGSNRNLGMFLEQREHTFVLAVKRDEPLWTLDERGPAQVRADRLAEESTPEDWQQLSAGVGSNGECHYDWALLPLFRLQLAKEERFWGHWLLLRRNLEDPDELAYYVVFAPKKGTTLEQLVKVAGTRWRMESGFSEAKGELGLDEYEVRRWAGWHRHITLCLLAHAFVGVVRSSEVARENGALEDLLASIVPVVRPLMCSLLLAKLPEEEVVLCWSRWRRRHQLRARRCHQRRRRLECPEEADA
jgi:SRSO17 transposase